jgi:hypothetical protein
VIKRLVALVSILQILSAPLLAQDSQIPELRTSLLALSGFVGWIVSASTRRQAIGGWLMYFYWALYTGVLWTAALVVTHLDRYVPQNFTASSHYTLLMWIVVPSIVLLVVQAGVATFLLVVRTPEMLRLLRSVMALHLAVSVTALLAEASQIPDGAPLAMSRVIAGTIWLSYLYKSERVKHVFLLNDWGTSKSEVQSDAGPVKALP